MRSDCTQIGSRSETAMTPGVLRPEHLAPRAGGEALSRLPPLEYLGHFIVKKITIGGTFRFRSSRLLSLANAMVDQHIGLEETDDGIWAIHFNNILLATFDERDYIISGSPK